MGRGTLTAFRDSDHEIRTVTNREQDNLDPVVADVTNYKSTVQVLQGCNVVIHLAGNHDPDADWESVCHVNIDGTQTIYEAAVENDLDRIVFASTNHITHMHHVPAGGTLDDLESETDAIRIGNPDRPDSFYAVSKITGEALGVY